MSIVSKAIFSLLLLQIALIQAVLLELNLSPVLSDRHQENFRPEAYFRLTGALKLLVDPTVIDLVAQTSPIKEKSSLYVPSDNL